jgi:hypothetical protein
VSDFDRFRRDFEDFNREAQGQAATPRVSSGPSVQYTQADADMLPPEARDRAVLSGADLDGLLQDRPRGEANPQRLTATIEQDGEVRVTESDSDQTQILKDLLDSVRNLPDQIVQALRS